MEYRIQQRATIWVQTWVEADTIEEAMEKADEQILYGDYQELADTFEPAGEWYAADENGKELELPEGFK